VASAGATSPRTGLGLAISKEVVEHMGGSIGYEAADGRGSVFFVDLPISSIDPRV